MLSIVKYIIGKYMYCKVLYNACWIKIVQKNFGIGSCRWDFSMHMWLFAWYDVLGLCFCMYMMTNHLEWRSRFYIFFSVTFLDSWRACFCLCIVYFSFTRKSRRLPGRLYAMNGFSEKKNFFATVWRLKYRKVFRSDLVEVWRSWIIGDYEWDALVAFVFWNAWF